jgi:hypothetical protein
VDTVQNTWFTIEDDHMGDCSNPYAWMGLGLLRSLDVYEAAQRCSPNPIPTYQVSEAHERKPAHTAYGVATTQLAGASYDRQLTTTETGSAQIEAYRFERPDTVMMVAAFTDNGERLGRIGSPPLQRTMTFNSSILAGWTGTLAIVNHLGDVRYETGSSIAVTLTQWPQYIRPY